MPPKKTNLQAIDNTVTSLRDYKVVKSNELIQKSRFQLSLQEQKIILYLISKIRPEDMELKEHTFEIIEFCKVCGIDSSNGANYRYIKQTLKELRDKSIWLSLENGTETTLAWIEKVTMSRQSGAVKIKIDSDMKPYLLQLQEKFTQYELFYTLAMRSQYSIRLYELLKSYEYQQRKEFDIEDLKRLLSAENYNRYPDFKRFVLERAIKEINELSDISVTYEVRKQGKKYSRIEFIMKLKKDADERMRTWARIEEILNPAQISLFDKETSKGEK